MIAEGPPANTCLAEIVRVRMASSGVSSSKFWGYAAWGQLLVDGRLGFQSALQRLTMSMADRDHSNVCQSCVPRLPPKNADVELANVGLVSETYVVVTNRSDQYSKWNEPREKNQYRNFDFTSIEVAIAGAVTNKLFVRLGSAGDTEKLASVWDGIVDLRSIAARNPCLDLAVQQNASGYFGAVSGPYSTFLLLKKPTAAVNILPLLVNYPTDPKRLLAIPKLLYDTNHRKLVHLKDMVKMPLAGMTHTDDYRRYGLECVENSPELVAEFLQEWLTLCGWGPETNTADLESEIVTRANFLRSRLRSPNFPCLPLSFYSFHPEIF